MDADDFVEIEPTARGKVGCAMKCSRMGKSKSERVSLTFRYDKLDKAAAQILQFGPRFNVAFSSRSRVIRISAADAGRYEVMPAARANGQVVILRFPIPPDMVFSAEKATVEVDFNEAQKAVFLEVPAQYLPALPVKSVAIKPADTPAAPPAPAPRVPFMPRMLSDVTGPLMGDPEPGRSALDGKPRA